MAAYRRVYDSRNLQADYQEPGSAMGYLFTVRVNRSAPLTAGVKAGMSPLPGGR